MKDLSENYLSLFEYYLEVRSEYYSLLGKVKSNKNGKKQLHDKIKRLKDIMNLTNKKLLELDEKIFYYATKFKKNIYLKRWIDFNREEKNYRHTLRKNEINKKEQGLIQNSYIRESLINNLIEQIENE